MSWKTAYRSFYYRDAPEPRDPQLSVADTALLVIDVQNTYVGRQAPGIEEPATRQWQPFRDRMCEVVTPAIAGLISEFRSRRMDVFFARIACQFADGRDRSVSQKRPGWNDLLIPRSQFDSQIIDELCPRDDEVVVTKTTDSALTGTNLRMMLHNVGIRNVVCVGIFTDQCVSSTVRSLADESFEVIVLDDACAAGTEDLHVRELEVLNMIYCNVMSVEDLVGYLPEPTEPAGGT